MQTTSDRIFGSGDLDSGGEEGTRDTGHAAARGDPPADLDHLFPQPVREPVGEDARMQGRSDEHHNQRRQDQEGPDAPRGAGAHGPAREEAWDGDAADEHQGRGEQ